MALSLRRRILWSSVASTLVIVFVAFLVADSIIRSTIERDQRETLVAATLLVAQLQDAVVEDYVERTASLATAPTLRAAVETRDPTTIRENLDLMLEGSAADWIAVTTPGGEVLAATDSMALLATAQLIESARFFDSAELWAVDGRLEEVHASGIFFGATQLGVVLSGVRIGPERVAEMQAGSQQRIAFLGAGEVVAADSLLTLRQRADLAAVWRPGPRPDTVRDGVSEFDLDGERHIGSAIVLPDGRGGRAGQLVTFRSLDAAMQPARAVRYALLAVATAGILFAFATSSTLASGVTTPVNRLLAEMSRVGSGNLDHPVEPERDDELGRLALGFESMRRSLKGAQEDLVRSERLSAVGRAASAIVHDIKQPVTVILGHVELLREDLNGKDGTVAEDLDVITHELGRLTQMMGEVLDYARGSESMHFTEGSVKDLLATVVRAVQPLVRTGNVRVVVAHGYDGLWRLDFARTRRALENLVRNAIAMLQVRGDGTVVLRSVVTDARNLRIEVEDDGPGVPAEIRDSLFEPFITHGKREGTGLGLAIVKAFTERQGGTVDYRTSASGTRFVLEFPPAEGDA